MMNIEPTTSISSVQQAAARRPRSTSSTAKQDKRPASESEPASTPDVSIDDSDVTKAAIESRLEMYPPPRSPVTDETKLASKELMKLSLIKAFLRQGEQATAKSPEEPSDPPSQIDTAS